MMSTHFFIHTVDNEKKIFCIFVSEGLFIKEVEKLKKQNKTKDEISYMVANINMEAAKILADQIGKPLWTYKPKMVFISDDEFQTLLTELKKNSKIMMKVKVKQDE